MWGWPLDPSQKQVRSPSRVRSAARRQHPPWGHMHAPLEDSTGHRVTPRITPPRCPVRSAWSATAVPHRRSIGDLCIVDASPNCDAASKVLLCREWDSSEVAPACYTAVSVVWGATARGRSRSRPDILQLEPRGNGHRANRPNPRLDFRCARDPQHRPGARPSEHGGRVLGPAAATATPRSGLDQRHHRRLPTQTGTWASPAGKIVPVHRAPETAAHPVTIDADEAGGSTPRATSASE
eukprot:CAMPEP_0206298480 /NCGR_PEP_ID=MMETSP0106_2-20121207/6708_1 /ASSEMBLY_ACC=CAM_ASM_000206 /TAXON_ID=81532 /ORGANISM="Acanthoeca-like sp., Strain 10tr" /LENGTH=237 /DNA_ID=CAMNT_0053729175 /DNA_START=166 /DNA_END=883 /DNA_ORIENTATION=+